MVYISIDYILLNLSSITILMLRLSILFLITKNQNENQNENHNENHNEKSKLLNFCDLNPRARSALQFACYGTYKGVMGPIKGFRSRVLPWHVSSALQSYLRPNPLYSPPLYSPPLYSPAPVDNYTPYSAYQY